MFFASPCSYDNVVDCSAKAGTVTINLVAKGSTKSLVFKSDYVSFTASLSGQDHLEQV